MLPVGAALRQRTALEILVHSGVAVENPIKALESTPYFNAASRLLHVLYIVGPYTAGGHYSTFAGWLIRVAEAANTHSMCVRQQMNTGLAGKWHHQHGTFTTKPKRKLSMASVVYFLSIITSSIYVSPVAHCG